MKPIQVILSDFQFLTREGLVHMLGTEEPFELIDVVEGSVELRASLEKQPPNVLILDYESSDSDLYELLREIVAIDQTQVLIITNHDNKRDVQELLDMGIKGIVTKGCSKMEIINAIQSISIGNRFFCNRILEKVITQPDDKDVTCDPADLSPREFDVLKLITKGRKTVEIADTLNVSVHTINSHRKNILRKLNLKSPAELIVYALEQGLTEIKQKY